jgi:hypothetical protein
MDGWPTKNAIRRGAATDKTLGRARVAAVLSAAGLPELMGVSEAAECLGVTTSNLKAVAGLPEPVYELRAGRFYIADEIRALRDRRAAARAAA